MVITSNLKRSLQKLMNKIGFSNSLKKKTRKKKTKKRKKKNSQIRRHRRNISFSKRNKPRTLSLAAVAK